MIGAVNRRFIMLLLILFVCMLLCSSCFASSITDDCIELPQSKVQEYVERLDLHVSEREPRNTNFDCFAVRKDQVFSIGYDEGGQRNHSEIGVYDASGSFLYTIVFDSVGSFDIMWEADTLLIYFYRGGLILALHEDGTCFAAYDSEDRYEVSERFKKTKRMTKTGIIMRYQQAKSNAQIRLDKL